MNQLSTEQFLSASKSTLADLNGLAASSLAGFEKLLGLNLSIARSTLAESAEQIQAVIAAKGPKDLSAVAVQTQPLAEKAAAYSRAVADIVNEAGSAFSKVAESKFAEVQSQTAANIEAVLKQAPAGSESAISAFKTVLGAGQSALETAQAQTKQVVEAASKTFASATDLAVKAAQTSSKLK